MKLTVTVPEQDPLTVTPVSDAEMLPPRLSLSEVELAATAAAASAQTLLKFAPILGGTVVVAALG